jgi:hypothetical protein
MNLGMDNNICPQRTPKIIENQIAFLSLTCIITKYAY